MAETATTTQPRTEPSFLGKTFRAFRHRDFRLMWLGACVSTIGTFVQQFAQSWLVYDITKDPFYLGLDLFLGQLPIILFSLVGGVFADRLDRRKMLLASQYIQMACAFVLAYLFGAQKLHGHIWPILLLSFLVGLGQSFGGPAYSALLPTLVPKEDLQNAIAMNSIQFNLARVLGPALGGFAYAAFGATWCFVINGFSYLAVIATLLMIHTKFVPQKSTDPILRSMGQGLSFIRTREGLSALVLLAFFTTSLGFSVAGFLPVIVQTVFHGGPKSYQLLLICNGVGAVIAGFLVAGSRSKQQGRIVLLTLVALGVAVTAFAFNRNIALACVLIFVCGFTIMVSLSNLLTLVQMIVPDNMRGRVMSVYNLAFRLGIPVGSLILGKVIPWVGLAHSLAGSGVLLIVIALYAIFATRNVSIFQRDAAGSV